MKTQVQEVVDRKTIQLPSTMRALQLMRTTKNLTDKQLHPFLNAAYTECLKNDTVTLLKRMLLHIGDVSRQHNYLKAKGVISASGGAQERVTFRSVLRWWEANLPDFYEFENLVQFVEFSVFENIFYNELRTDRKTGKLLAWEHMDFDLEKIAKFIAVMTVKVPHYNVLIAKHLPRYSVDTRRTAKKIAKGKTPIFNWRVPEVEWVKVNGERVEIPANRVISVKSGDILSYPRKRQAATLAKQKMDNALIKLICKEKGWSLKQYNAFRSIQNTPEQVFSSKAILNAPKDAVMQLFDRMTAAQRFRVSKMLCYKDNLNKLQPKPKWESVAKYFVEWENAQSVIADQFRKAKTPEEKKKIGEKLKVKATGMQTIDLLYKLTEGTSAQEVDTTYEALMKRFEMKVNIFPVVDGSASMTANLPSPYSKMTFMDVAFAMGIIFSTQNPNPEFKNTFGWFSRNFKLVGTSKYVTSQVNPYVIAETKEAKEYRVLSEKEPFSENFKRMHQANPGIAECTNIGAVVEFFVDWQKRTGQPVEELPKALLFVTDNEGNTGMTPKQFSEHAASIGWFPLFIFWGIRYNSMEQYKNVPNCLFLGGFSEGVLNQIILGIREGSIDPQTELWSIYDDPRYQFMN